MTVTHPGSDSSYEAATDEELHEHHPSDGTYWKVGAILGVLTALEVSTYFISETPYEHEAGGVIIAALLVMMTAKFITIIAYFMHLRFDNKLFRNVFVSGLVLAVVVYVIAISTLHFWSGGYENGLAVLG